MCDVSAKLIAWQDGELPDEEAPSIERHVATCAECRNRLEAYQKVSALVDAYCNAALAVEGTSATASVGARAGRSGQRGPAARPLPTHAHRAGRLPHSPSLP